MIRTRVPWSRGVRAAGAATLAGAMLLAGGVLVHPAARAVAAPPPAYVPVYSLTDLGHASGDTDSFANGINADGDATGWTAGGVNGQRAFRYSGTTLTPLDHLNGSVADVGFAIDDAGLVAGGEGDFQSFSSLAALTWSGTTPTNIASGQTAIAEGENGGQVVGLLEPTPSTAEAFLYDTGSIIDLNTVVHSGDTSLDMEEATGINTGSQIVGDGQVGAGPLRAFFFDSETGALTNLGVLGGKTADGTVALGLNEAGDAVGYQFGTLNHAFMWDGSLHDLGTLSGYPTASASAINATDWVVGYAAKGSGASTVYHAVVWAGGAPVDLNTRVKLPAGWVLQFATDINDAGQIVGGALVNGHEHAFRLTPSNVSRTFGADRYTTAAEVSAQNFTSPQATVYIANGQNFPDALGGAALAGHKGAPLLLVPTSGALPASVATELQRLAPTNIVIFGGTGAVSAAMATNITTATGVTPSRIAGTDRYDTAAKISALNYTAPQAKVYIANGQNFPDALGGAALAGRDGAPLLLVPDTGTLPAPVLTELQRLAPTSIVVFGGTASVSDAMASSILSTVQMVAPTATLARLAGATRYDTAATIAMANYTDPQPLVYIANGQNFPDALAGAALAAAKGAPLLLVPTSGALPANVGNELYALAPTSIVIFGGTGAVSTSMEELIAKY
ncbi:MAG TPA: cell wall-binding repeat-containing protein [Candidatus Sulfotelmatobacter sp.]|nr:cell wall-binding repeat-containing protein [Candidatus Sulfotelmatobacter sp.]